MLKLILLPGMDGTGKLFEPIIEQLYANFDVHPLHYPADRLLSYPELEELVSAALPKSQPFVILAESFSTPLAVMLAARNPPHLKGVILCAGFVACPARGWRRSICTHLAPFLFNWSLPKIAVRSLLVGSSASAEIVNRVQSAISSVKPELLLDRLRAVLTCDARPQLKLLNHPILYLQAKQDRLIDPRCLEEIRQSKPDVRVEQLQGPHLLLQTQPEQSAVILESWLHEITHCTLCKRALAVDAEPLSGDCGGDCWGCISEIEAEMIGVPLDKYRGNPNAFLPH
jgi:pimeloyl-ACP methyl ester carboxylesterase